MEFPNTTAGMAQLQLACRGPVVSLTVSTSFAHDNAEPFLFQPIEQRHSDDGSLVYTAYELVRVSTSMRRRGIYLVTHNDTPCAHLVRDIRPERFPASVPVYGDPIIPDGECVADEFDFGELAVYALHWRDVASSRDAAKLAVEYWSAAHLINWPKVKPEMLAEIKEPLNDDGTSIEQLVPDLRDRILSIPDSNLGSPEQQLCQVVLATALSAAIREWQD